jgi:hypothetical protein
MKERTCACRRWELTGIPCKHAVATIWNMAAHGIVVGLPESFVNPLYRMERWKEVYNFKIFPINGKSMWQKSQVPTVLTAPTHHTPVGRPRKARKRSAIEIEDANTGGRLSKKLSTVRCAKCNKRGHNSRTCKGQGQEEV